MNICMIVHNNATRDGRVMREAHSLKAAGHAVTVIGIPEGSATEPLERLDDGVIVRRVNWHPRARQRLIISAIPRTLLFAAIFAAIGFATYRLLTWSFGTHGPIPRWRGEALAFIKPPIGFRPAATTLVGLAVVLAIVALCSLAVGAAVAAIGRKAKRNDAIRRKVILENKDERDPKFPAIRSKIPDWIPDWLLEIAVEPLDWFGARTGRFSMYRYRSEELAAAAIALRPDVVHCHDCVALPTGWLVKRQLQIPLIYDAHEIYEAVAARRFGATDYFARVHRKYLPRIDGFIAVNDSAATYYRHAYPAAPQAVVIRNATDEAPRGDYAGQLHRAAGLALTDRILLYQGGFTKHRGLDTLVRSAKLLSDDWFLVMMGWGPLTDELKKIAQRPQGEGPSEKVRFVPAVPPSELLTWTQGATVGIVPYEDKMLNHWIATPNKLWEYPNAGVPMIVQPFPEMRRIVETYGCGWLLPEEFTAGGIANLVASLSEEAIAKAREGCRKFVEKDNWALLYRPRLLELYERIGLQIMALRDQRNIASSVGGMS
jgi:glycosyltransferase involved in cell wall biosynthesis